MHPKLKILEEKAKAATQGPWFPNSSPHYRGPISEVEMFYTTDDDGIHFPEKDAKFMAAANPETVQKLVMAIQQMELSVRACMAGEPDKARAHYQNAHIQLNSLPV